MNFEWRHDSHDRCRDKINYQMKIKLNCMRSKSERKAKTYIYIRLRAILAT